VRTIVVPTDCSALSAEALRYAERLASSSDATVVAVYGARFSSGINGVGVAHHQDAECMKLPIRKCMEETVSAALDARTKREIVIEDCAPADAIVEHAETRDADLIIMGTHDRNRLTRAVLGSITDEVLHRSRRPVLILREHNVRQVRRIFCPYRDTPHSAAAIREAKNIAQTAGAELTLYEVTDMTDIAARVLSMAKESEADLIVIGTEHRRFSDPSEVGRPAAEIVRAAYCPVLSVTA
jgi:nucleotide-binding universal stress UspA family protein